MTLLLVNIVLAAIPSVILVIFFYRKDRRKREPPMLVWALFVAGFFAVVPAALIEQLFGAVENGLSPTVALVVRAFVIAGLIEETTKLGVVRLFVYRRREFDEITDGMVYTITVGLGFALFENVLYSFGPAWLLIVRGVTAVPLHAISAGILGYYVGRSKLEGRRLIGRGLLLAILIHGGYDFLLMSSGWPAVLVIPLLIVLFGVLLRLYRKALEADRLAGRS